MQDWKQQIVDRLCLPLLSEARFNVIWDNADQKKILDGTNDELFYLALGVRAKSFTPREALPWQHCAALWEFGDENYIGLLTKKHSDIYFSHRASITAKSVREEQVARARSLWQEYNPQAVAAVLYGYDCNHLIDEDIAGRPPKDPYERIAWLSFYWDTLTKGEHPLDCIKRDAREDRFAVILPERYEYILKNSDWLCRQVMSIFRPTGILIAKNHPGTLYHTTTHADKILEDAGFNVSGEIEENTFGGDVVYAYPNTTHMPSLRVRVRKYMEAVCVVDKDDADQGECIFFPGDVISIERC